MHNGRYFFQNDNKVTLFFTGSTWALDLTHNSTIDVNLIEKGPDDIQPWDPSGYYYPSDIGSHVGIILPEGCSSSSYSSDSSSKSSGSSISSRSSTSSSSSSQTLLQGYKLCLEGTDIAIGTFGDFSRNPEFLNNTGKVAFVIDQRKIIVSNGDGSFIAYPNVLGTAYNIGLEREILHRESAIGEIFFATDTKKLYVSQGAGMGYTVYGDTELPIYCADGFSGDYYAVNGSYQVTKDNVGNTLLYNGKPYYKNENAVTLFYNENNRWSFDLAENTEISVDFIEKPEDSSGPEGNYFLSDIGSQGGHVEVGACQVASSSSSTTPATTVYAGAIVELDPQPVPERFRMETEVGDVVIFEIKDLPGNNLSVQHGSLAPNDTPIAILDSMGVYGGPFPLSEGQTKVLRIAGINVSVTFVSIGSIILEYRLHDYCVYESTTTCDT